MTTSVPTMGLRSVPWTSCRPRQSRGTRVHLDPGALQAPVCRPAGMRGLGLLSPSLQRPRVPVETPPGIRAEMHIWDTPEAGMMVTCPSLVGTGL